MQSLRRLACIALLGAGATGAGAAVEIAGVPVEETIVVQGVPLVLNGAGYRKRGYFKVDVTALYAQQRFNSLEVLEKTPGTKRVELIIQQDLSGSQASRYFLIDFEASATPAEFGQLINEVSQVGSVYGALPKIRKGDVATFDIIPGKGIMATLNGAPLIPHGATTPYFNNELLARIIFRMYVAGKTPQELRDNLLGLSYSMRDHPPTAGTAATGTSTGTAMATTTTTAAVPAGLSAASAATSPIRNVR